MSRLQRLSVKMILMLSLIGSSVTDKNGENVYCRGITIADSLYSRMFPSNIIKTNDIVKPRQMDNSSCYMKIDKSGSDYNGERIVTITGNPNSMDFFVNDVITRAEDCTSLPDRPPSLLATSLVISATRIITFSNNSFINWSEIPTLRIVMNKNLTSIEPGTFNGLDVLWKLEIMDNPALSGFKKESLIGMPNLRGLFLQRNNITHIADISIALSPNHLPYLLHLDLTGNNIMRINEWDFLPLNKGSLYSLNIGLTKTEYIHPRALDPLGDKLVALGFSKINVNKTNMIAFINRTTVANANLRYISVEQDLFCGFPRELMQVMSNKTIGVSLKRNHFGLLKPGYFPVMHRLKYLDLTEVTMDYLPDGVINYTVLPHLDHLYLGSNMFTKLTSSMVTPTLSRLVINKDSDNLASQQSTSDFQLEDSVLKMTPILELLDLSGNKLNMLTRETFRYAPNLKVLLLKRTALTKICTRAFEKNKLLYYLDLSYNPFPLITTMTSDTFLGLVGLLALDLSYCNINQLEDDVFKHVPKLQYLALRGNPIFKLNAPTFKSISYLKILDLRYNILVTWDNSIFSHEHCLQQFLLSYNNIFKLSPAMINDFKKVAYVDLYANSIICDCELIVNIHNANINSTNSSFVKETKCSYPSKTNLLEYLSTPISRCVSYRTAIIVSCLMFVLFVAFFLTVMYYKYRYDIQYKLLLMKKKLGIVNNYRVKRCSSLSAYYQYDAFVSYSALDSSFVEKMMMILEKDGSKFKLCVFERDFQPGDNLVDKILECMEVSMVTILVLTEAFARSEWCRWEMSIAQNKVISQRFLKDCLILIMKSHVDESLMTPTLRYLMDTRVYLEWHEHSSVRQNIFWEKLKDALLERTQKRMPVGIASADEASISWTVRKRVGVAETTA